MCKLKKTYSKYIHNENAKRLFSNFASLSILQVISYLFPLITTPYLARVIGVTGFGWIAFAAAVITYFSTVTDWGFRYTAVREIAKQRENDVAVSMIFFKVILSKIILMSASAVLLLILTLTIPLFRENSLILWATFLLIPGYILFPDWLFQAMEEMRFITLMNLSAKTIFTVLIFVLIKEASDYVVEPLLQACGYIASGIIGFIYAIRHYRLRLYIPSIKECIEMMRESTNMFLSQFFPTLYNNLSIILLGAISGTIANGLYSAGNKFVSIMDQLSQALSRAFYPFLARRMDKHSTYVKISLVISILMSLFLFLSADLIIKIFFTPAFHSAAAVTRIMSPAPFFLFLMNSYGTNGLALIDKDNILRNIVIYSSLGGMVLAIIGIMMFSYYGVAIAVTVTWGARGLLSYGNFKKITSKQYSI